MKKKDKRKPNLIDEKNLQYFVFKFLNFYEQFSQKSWKIQKKNKIAEEN